MASADVLGVREARLKFATAKGCSDFLELILNGDLFFAF